MIEVIFFFTFFCIFQYLRNFIQGSLLLYSIAPSHLPFHHHLELFFLSDNQTSTIHLPTHIPLLMVHSHDTSSSMIFFSATVIISDYFSYVSRILHPLSPTRCISLFLIWNFIRWNYYFSFILLSMAGDEDQTYTRNACLMHCPTLPKMIDRLVALLLGIL